MREKIIAELLTAAATANLCNARSERIAGKWGLDSTTWMETLQLL